MLMRRNSIWTVAVALLLFAAPAAAQEQVSQPLDASRTLSYWTEAQYAAAQPVAWRFSDRPVGDPVGPEERGAQVDRVWPASLPKVQVPAMAPKRLFQPPADSAEETEGAVVDPRDVGGSKAQFSSSRLLPLEADQFFPFVTVGKLFFTIPGVGNASCSAAVIARRLVLTAGHCVHSGLGPAPANFFTNFLFVPAFRDGVAPIGEWPATAVIVTGTWVNGGGTVPNGSDFAILELDELLFTDGLFHPIGDVLGWLGWKINALKQNHVHILGYPKNLDNGTKMHQVAAQIRKYTAGTNTSTAGSDMMQGSSGGPWVQNFGLLANGQKLKGGLSQLDLIVGVTSFGPVAKAPKFAGSSMPDNRFVALFNVACDVSPGNC